MSGLRLSLGWNQFLETDRSALPAIQGVCRSLDIPAHWNEAERTLYIAAPVHGRKVALTCGENGADIAARIIGGLNDRLTAAGAVVTIADDTLAAHDSELVLRIDIAAQRAQGVSAAFNWVGWRLNRRLAAILTAEISASLDVPDLGGRVTLAGWKQAGVPIIDLSLPEPEAPNLFAGRCIEALCRGLTRFWANPLLEEVLSTAPQEIIPPEAIDLLDTDQPPEPQPQPETAAPLEVPAERQPMLPAEEPVLVLGPETIVASRVESLDEEDLLLPPKRPRRLAKKQSPAPPAAAEVPPPPAPAPAPSPEAPPSAPRLQQPTSTFHQIAWTRARITGPAVQNQAPLFRIFHQGIPVARKNHPR